MSNTSTATANPAVDAGSISQPQPNISIVPKPKKRRVPRRANALTKVQSKEVELTLHLCTEGLKPAYAPGLAANTVPAVFLTDLQRDALAVQNTGRSAVNTTNSKEACTADETAARIALMANLRKIQSAARAAYGDTQPQRVNNYLVGNDIDASRATLETSSLTIINQANADHPGEIDAEFVAATIVKRNTYVNCCAAQETDIGTGKQQRDERDAMMKTITERRMKVQRAADTAWPYGKVSSVKARKLFRLPADRPYSY